MFLFLSSMLHTYTHVGTHFFLLLSLPLPFSSFFSSFFLLYLLNDLRVSCRCHDFYLQILLCVALKSNNILHTYHIMIRFRKLNIDITIFSNTQFVFRYHFNNIFYLIFLHPGSNLGTLIVFFFNLE